MQKFHKQGSSSAPMRTTGPCHFLLGTFLGREGIRQLLTECKVPGCRADESRLICPDPLFFFFLHSLLRTTALGSETSCNQLLFIFEPQLFFGVLWLCRSSSPPPPPLAGPGGGGARLSRPNPKNLAVSGGGVILFCPIVSVKITWEI